MGKRKERARNADNGRMAWYNHYYNLFYLYATNMIEWKGNIPDTIDVDTIEKLLITRGMCAIHDKYMGELTVMRMQPIERRDIYGYPVSATIMSYNDIYKDVLPAKDFVGIYNNNIWQPITPFLSKWAFELADIKMMIAVNRNANKNPLIYRARSDKQKLALDNMFDRIERNEPAIMVDDTQFESSAIQVIDTKAKYLINDLLTYQDKLIAEVCEFLGISTLDTEKDERLVAGEVNANKERIQMARITMLKKRQQCAEKANKKFKEYGLEMYPEFALRSMRESVEFLQEINANKVGAMNGNNDGAGIDNGAVPQE